MVARVNPPAVMSRGCLNADGTPKIAYSNRDRARRVARSRRRDGAGVLDTYACDRHGWHIGHRTEWFER